MSASDTWADHLRFVPWIEDGHGVLFNEAFQLSKFAGAQSTEALSFTLDPSFHATGVVE